MRIQLRSIVLGAIALFAGIPFSALQAQQAGEIKIEKRSFKTKAGDLMEYEIGTLFVPENRNDSKSRVIGVGFARFPATEQPAKAPPVFRLPGGPGSSYVSRLNTSNDNQRQRIMADLASIRKFCDVVFVDQRGFSEAGDVLRATMRLPARSAQQQRTLQARVSAFKAFARQAVAEFEARKVDLRGYTVKECAHDVAELSKVLGYDKITLNGTSFGSQWSFAIMRLHPDIVARALLSGVEPLDHGYDMPSHIFAAVRRMWRTIDQDPRFKPYLPEGGMAEAARVVIERLEREPQKIEVADQKSGQKKTIAVVGPADFPWRDPTQILELYHGRTNRLMWRTVREGFVKQRQIRLIGPLIDSSLGVTPQRRHQLWTDPATRYLGRGNFAPYLATADIWPSPDVGDGFRTPILSEIPVVFAQGDWDIQTPIENTFEIAPFFINSRVIIGERGGHGIFGPLADQSPKVWEELEEFLRTGDMNGIPPRVRLRPSRRFTPPNFEVESP